MINVLYIPNLNPYREVFFLGLLWPKMYSYLLKKPFDYDNDHNAFDKN